MELNLPFMYTKYYKIKNIGRVFRMNKKILGVTLSALLLCSGGLATTAHAKELVNKQNITASYINQANVVSHYWVYQYRDYVTSYYDTSMRLVYVYDYHYYCPECGATKVERNYVYQ